ncbi:MAG: sigma-70 family RNA polymerase sigma factor [Candidatus Moduliflexus flocculans]|nr:sigma-70 family RNA polymerase sigma factor [Candidatus Moduliflexus flocculans]
MKTDEELAREARAGSRSAFEELALRYKRRLFVYLRPRLGSDQDTEDMVQETFLKLYRNIDRYDPAYRFSTWLYTAATRLAISSYRKKRIAAGPLRSEEAGGVADPAAGPPAGTETAGLWDSARTLAETQFRALWLRYGEDMEVAEIARALGKSRVAVSLLLHRARTNLMKKTGAAPAGAMSAARPAAAGGPTAG